MICGARQTFAQLRETAAEGGLGTQLMAVVGDGPRGREFFSPGDVEDPPTVDRPVNAPTCPSSAKQLLTYGLYGIRTQADLYTNRQLLTLGAFADAVTDVPSWVETDGGSPTYGAAIASILALCVGKLAMANSTQARWKIDSRNGSAKAESAFARHALPMVWDFPEVNPFGGSVGDWTGQIEATIAGLLTLPLGGRGHVVQRDARAAADLLEAPGLIATDPPYFGQIGYADLSDYFYVWHRRALLSLEPDLYSTLATPKGPELIEAPHRHGGDRVAAKHAFVQGFTTTFHSLQAASRPDLPMLIVYAHRSDETVDGEVASTGWDAMLTAIIEAGLGIEGTWPIHATGSSRQIGLGANALASYVVLVCRPRSADAPITTRRDFIAALRQNLPEALRALQYGGVAPIDLAQAAIGPGMGIFSRYARVIEADGSGLSIRTALQLINQALDEVLASQEGEIDAYTRFAVDWFQAHGFSEGPYGEAELLATAKGTAVRAIEQAGIMVAKGGKACLLPRDSLDPEWNPATDTRLTVWEITQHLIKRLQDEGEASAGQLLGSVGGYGDSARELAYRLFLICDRKGWASEALGYNALGASWNEISQAARSAPFRSDQQSFEV